MTARTTTDATAASTRMTTTLDKQSSLSSVSPEFVAVVLASSTGTRLFPLTSSTSLNKMPKHLLPVAGIPVLHRLLDAIVLGADFTHAVVAIAAHDQTTIASLREHYGTTRLDDETKESDDAAALNPTASAEENDTVVVVTDKHRCKVTVVRLAEDCSGSGHALRILEEMNHHHHAAHGTTSTSSSSSSSSAFLPKHAHTVVFPGDLIVLDPQPLQAVVHAHRRQQQQQQQQRGATAGQQRGATAAASACTVLLSAVGEQDEHGIPLKESAKQKKGGLAREDEEIEYMALSYETPAASNNNNNNNRLETPAARLVWKQAKLDAEEDQGTGATPKLVLPKPRLRTTTRVRTDWNDVHVYVLAPWVRQLVQARDSIISLREDLLPLLIARQFKGITATFGSSSGNTAMATTPTSNSGAAGGGGDAGMMDESNRSASARRPSPMAMSPGGAVTSGALTSSPLVSGNSSNEYAVRALVREPTILRSHSLPAYLYANREVVRAAFAAGTDNSKNKQKQLTYQLGFPTGSNARAKFQSIVLADTTLGDKVNFKSAVVGQGCKIGAKCRLNNVVLLNGVTVGDNTILQNTVVAAQASIGDHCSLNDCQVGPNKSVPNSTKEKGESFVVDDFDEGM